MHLNISSAKWWPFCPGGRWVIEGFGCRHKDLVRLPTDIHHHRIRTCDFSRIEIAVIIVNLSTTLQWRHNGCDSLSNHQPHDCLLNRLFRSRSKKTSKLRVTGLCAGISPGTGEFPAQMASNAENVSIWWRHHEYTDSYKGSITPWLWKGHPCWHPRIHLYLCQ